MYDTKTHPEKVLVGYRFISGLENWFEKKQVFKSSFKEKNKLKP